eukprot:4653679-Amphidinium_carterae.1
MFATAALPTQQGGTSAGTAILLQAHIQAVLRSGPDAVALHGRITAVDGLMNGSCILVSGYLPVSTSRAIKQRAFAALIQWLRTLDRPWLMGADFNVTPHMLQEWRVADLAHAVIRHTNTSTTTTNRCLDFFLASHCLAQKLGP